MLKFFSSGKEKNEKNVFEYDIMKYKLANDALGIALWDMDVVSADSVNFSNKIKYSQEFRRMLGFSGERDFPDMLSSWSDRLHPEDKERTIAAFASHINDRTGKTPFNIEYRLMLKNGNYRYFQALGTTMRNSAGVPLRVAGALMDIDEKKHTQTQLMIMSSIVHNSPNFASYKKINGECLYINPAASLITGYTEDELKKDYLGSLFDEETAKQITEKILNDLHENGISNYEAKWKTKDGAARLFAGTSFLIEKDTFASIASDVTEVRKIEAEKIEALNTMKNILEELDAIIYVTDPDTGEILFMNNSMRRHYGIEGDVDGCICYKVLQRDLDERCVFCPCHKLDIDPDSVIVWEITDPFTKRIHRKTDRYIKWPDGKTVHLQHSVDITDLIQANEHSRQMAEELKTALLETQEANRAKSDFLSRMSHEMLTPMNAIMGMTQIIKMRAIPDNLKEDHDRIENASRHLLKLIHDLLDATGRNDGSFRLVESDFSFYEMFKGVIKEIGPAVVGKQQTLSFDIDQSIGPSLIGDEKRLAQVIFHLLSNAVKFTPERGEISFSVRALNEDSGIVSLQIEVRDNGIGIPKERQNEIFNLFEQVDGGLTRKADGVGLGLSLAEHIIELMGGKIWVESEPGQGSTFTFTCNLKKG